MGNQRILLCPQHTELAFTGSTDQLLDAVNECGTCQIVVSDD